MKKIFLSAFFVITLALSASAGDYYAVGVDCFNKGLYDKAVLSFEHAIRINPKNVNARYYLAQAYLSQKRNTDAIEQYKRIILLSPSSEAARLSQLGISLIQQSYQVPIVASAQSAAPLPPALAKYSDNYFDYVIAGPDALIRWAAFPISVYVPNTKFKPIVLDAFNQWQTGTQGFVHFKFVNSPQSAQIVVDFRSKLETTSTKDSYIAGFSKPYYQGKNIVKSEINLLTNDPQTGVEIEREFIKFTAMHEIGHSLGLKGHSPSTSDVMYAQSETPKLALTNRDLNTVMLLYKIDKATMVARNKGQTDVQLQQALDYVKNTPEKSVGWSNLGDIYRGKKMYSDAIKSYQKAISIEPGKPELYNLLGAAYVGANDYNNAYSYLKKACDMDKNNPFYLYQFAKVCLKINQKDVGKSYLNAYIKANPQNVSDEKVQSLLQLYR